MKREIKFRALVEHHDGDKEWLFYTPKTGKVISDLYVSNKIRRVIVDDLQFTGLHDKYSKEIYEGDIINIEHWKSSDPFDYSKPFVVVWKDGQIDFQQGKYHNFIGSLVGAKKFEVIGNIHENPELIEDK